MRQLVLEIPPLHQPSFDNFVIGKNHENILLLKNWTQRIGDPLVYLWGESGSGKSHLLTALKELLTQHQHNIEFIAATPETILKESQSPFLLIDDVQRLSSEGAVSLFNRFNERREEGLRLLVSGDAPPHQLSLLPDLSTRLSWGLVLRLHALSDENKVEALQKHAINLGFHLSNELAQYLLQRWQRDIRSLLQVLEELNRWSLSLHKPITMPLVRDALNNLKELSV
ncbi:MAG: DnaA regulatory inactivator Hda [Ferrovum sp. 37-45-19]|uniref:DnaA regulatory inactivator Hda n=1 Tax=Ferrovum sp. JA12 TaxID=1356299 RepID=UPI0007035BA2|nr:DnaA regulatory inactivator Hda [Ferrovum sp. JA12]OYV79858.1 MAG: DnaA regulatory inactivator Hda [Ferrovum sp. 21-44-67]OYV95482.1 MAG: DnaA regulatory inactivator Hda [Ferrovum sp. 37-45-19]HQT81278.1 DnaA regulatory inactivator Hda [Ferrovaceae bacterium]KRH78165.1 DnaA regulatory inactivator Hda [Ferrovum sp. JA12]HQU05731.1 DnaA regulatory inactivator Hda [Ferrovaceae bacterium]